ncbi:acetoacetate--CoA ligase [Bacillus sp. FJAT-29814]|uniref:acetoacetate--CoA ligase n=1 Tax=Bacillus sp. FJAT-29814 TaxID=1729688 RepID=UPI0008320495|nr:acetoacetate--CoA ligase [Bacillus sp. FJAT-29814]
MTAIINKEEVLWQPSAERQAKSNSSNFLKWLSENKGLVMKDYQAMWEWSTNDIDGFWSSIWEYFSIHYSGEYSKVLDPHSIPGAKWFSGTNVNYAEHIFRTFNPEKEAILFESESHVQRSITWQELYESVAAAANGLKSLGIESGDRVAAYAPNIPETVISFLACASIGAIWSSCSPDFGSKSAIDRFAQITPKVLLTVDGYRYNGKDFDRSESIQQLLAGLPSVEKTIIIPYLRSYELREDQCSVLLWNQFLQDYATGELQFNRVPFDHPLWILYSSGTTGIPKGIVHSQGGILLEHLKNGAFHLELKPEDRFFWYTTTGWMMWNVVVSGLLSGATILLYDGNPAYPSASRLWEFAERTKMTFFGTSPTFLSSCIKNGIEPGKTFNLTHLESIGSTGSPLTPEIYQWVYKKVKQDVWLSSSSGGTDICSGFVGGTLLQPVYAGQIQCRTLGAAVQAFDENGAEVVEEIGELVISKPMPSMPIYFWNDPEHKRYKQSYFDYFPNVWRHGDFIKITSLGSCIIYGRSDATINRGGVRMGTSEFYSAVESHPSVFDSLVVDVPNDTGTSAILLFVVLRGGNELDQVLKDALNRQIKESCSPRHIPDHIYSVTEIPRTLNGKKMEVPIKKILMGTPIEKALNIDSLANPQSIHQFMRL